MEFFVQQAVLDAGVKIIFPVIRGMDNTCLLYTSDAADE